MGAYFQDPPATLPEFATDNVVDPTSGVNNVVEPSSEQKQYGWFPFRKRPERNVFNWLFRHIYNQLHWLNHDWFYAVDAFCAGTLPRLETLEHESIVGSVQAHLLLVNNEGDENWTGLEEGSAGAIDPLDDKKLNFTLNYLRYRNMVVLHFPTPFVAGYRTDIPDNGMILEFATDPNLDIATPQNAVALFHGYHGPILGYFNWILSNTYYADMLIQDPVQGTNIQNVYPDTYLNDSQDLTPHGVGISGQSITLKCLTDTRDWELPE